MKKIWLLAALIGFTSACKVHYDITTYNGSVIRAATKPRLNERGEFIYRDGLGQEAAINRLRVRKIEAVHPGDPPSTGFN